jgi:hypothetical protein
MFIGEIDDRDRAKYHGAQDGNVFEDLFPESGIEIKREEAKLDNDKA